MKTHVLFCLALLAAGCDSTTAPAPAEAATRAPLKIGVVEQIPFTPTIEITGGLEPIASVQLGFDVPGRISALLVTRGQSVSSGDPVARLDSALAQSQLAQAEAAHSAAKAQSDVARSGWERVEKLGDALSPQQRAEAEAGFQAAEAMEAQAEAAVRLARTNVGFHTLKAPINGVVTNSPDNSGILIGAGTPMFVIEDLSALRLKGSVPETETWIEEGMRVKIQSGSTEVEGIVETVIPSLDPATRRIPVEIRVDNPGTQVRAHSFVRATVFGHELSDAIAVPKGALVARPDFSVMIEETPGAAPKIQPVQLLGEVEGKVILRADLPVGTRVVVDPPHGYGE